MKLSASRISRYRLLYLLLIVVALIVLGLYHAGIFRPDMYFRSPYQQPSLQINPDVICYVLPAGGARQISYASAVADVFYEHELEPDVLVGASGGAILAVLLGQDLDPEVIGTQWAELTRSRFGSSPPVVARLWALGYFFRLYQSTAAADELFASLRTEIAYDKIHAVQKGVALVAANADREPVVFHSNIDAKHLPAETTTVAVKGEADLELAIRASSTVPFLMRPSRLGGEELFDGVLARPTDLELVLRTNCFQKSQRQVLVVYIDGNTESRIVNPPTWRQSILLQHKYSEPDSAVDSTALLVVRPEFRDPLPGGDYYQEVVDITQAAKEDAVDALRYLRQPSANSR